MVVNMATSEVRQNPGDDVMSVLPDRCSAAQTYINSASAHAARRSVTDFRAIQPEALSVSEFVQVAQNDFAKSALEAAHKESTHTRRHVRAHAGAIL